MIPRILLTEPPLSIPSSDTTLAIVMHKLEPHPERRLKFDAQQGNFRKLCRNIVQE
jgi:hypothetical protein